MPCESFSPPPAGIAIGGDSFPGSTLSDHCLRYQNIPQIKMIVVLGELGGVDEYSLVEALKAGKVGKYNRQREWGCAGIRARTAGDAGRASLISNHWLRCSRRARRSGHKTILQAALALPYSCRAAHAFCSALGSTHIMQRLAVTSRTQITKPVVAWVSGTCAKLFKSEVQFGHAGARGGGADAESAQAKNAALAAVGAVVPESFEGFEGAIAATYKRLVEEGVVVPAPDVVVPGIPMDLEAAMKAGKVRDQ